MKIQNHLSAQKENLTRQLNEVENEAILSMVEEYLQELVALQNEESEWSDADQIAIVQGISDLDVGKGIKWEDFKARFARYEA